MQILHLQHGAVAHRALGGDRRGEIEGGCRPVVPGPVLGILGVQGLADKLLSFFSFFIADSDKIGLR